MTWPKTITWKQFRDNGRTKTGHKYSCKCADCKLRIKTKFDPIKLYRVETKIRLYNEVLAMGGDVNKVLAIKI